MSNSRLLRIEVRQKNGQFLFKVTPSTGLAEELEPVASHGKKLADWIRKLESFAEPVSDAYDPLRSHDFSVAASQGSDLFSELPERLRVLLSSAVGTRTPVNILSPEPYLPWNLLKFPDHGPFLGETFALSHGFGPQTPRSCIRPPLRKIAVVVSSAPARRLPLASEEEDHLHALRNRGIEVVSIEPSRRDVLNALEDGGFDGWHFIGHASATGDEPKLWRFVLNNLGETLVPADIGGRDGSIRDSRAVVVFNACETGHVGPSILAYGGWPIGFLKAGAIAFIGTLWGIRDSQAASFTKKLYAQLLKGGPIAEAVLNARLGLRNEIPESSAWLAYSVYTHPDSAIDARAVWLPETSPKSPPTNSIPVPEVPTSPATAIPKAVLPPIAPPAPAKSMWSRPLLLGCLVLLGSCFVGVFVLDRALSPRPEKRDENNPSVQTTNTAGTPAAPASAAPSAMTPDGPMEVEAGGHLAPISWLSADAEGKTLATAAGDGSIRFWNLGDRRLLWTLRPAQEVAVESSPRPRPSTTPIAALSPSGGWLALTIPPRSAPLIQLGLRSTPPLRLFDWRTRTWIRDIENLVPDSVHALGFDRTGKALIATFGSQTGFFVNTESTGLAVVDPGSGSLLRRERYEQIADVLDFDDQGRFATLTRDGTLRLYDPRTWTATDSWGIAPTNLARLAPDGKRLAARVDAPEGIAIVGLGSGAKAANQIRFKGSFVSAAWSVDGRHLFAGVRGRAILRRWGPLGAPSSAAKDCVVASPVLAMNALPGGQIAFATASGGWGIIDSSCRIEAWVEPAKLDFEPGSIRLSKLGDRLAIERTKAPPLEFSLVDFRLSDGDFDRSSFQAPRLAAPGLAVEFRVGQLLINGQERQLPPGEGESPQVPNVLDNPFLQSALGGEYEKAQRQAEQQAKALRELGGLLSGAAGERFLCYTISPNGLWVAVGTSNRLTLFGKDGQPLRSRAVPSAIRSVIISGDNRNAMVGLENGTIQWYRLDDLSLLLNLFVDPGRPERFAIWTPGGEYEMSEGTPGLLGRWVPEKGLSKWVEVGRGGKSPSRLNALQILGIEP